MTTYGPPREPPRHNAVLAMVAVVLAAMVMGVGVLFVMGVAGSDDQMDCSLARAGGDPVEIANQCP